jgi:hypothetical protein
MLLSLPHILKLTWHETALIYKYHLQEHRNASTALLSTTYLSYKILPTLLTRNSYTKLLVNQLNPRLLAHIIQTWTDSDYQLHDGMAVH